MNEGKGSGNLIWESRNEPWFCSACLLFEGE